jgi:hypothetical protein
VKLTTHLCIVLRLRTSGAMLPLHLYAFMSWTGSALPLRFMSPLCHVSLWSCAKLNSGTSLPFLLLMICNYCE